MPCRRGPGARGLGAVWGRVPLLKSTTEKGTILSSLLEDLVVVVRRRFRSSCHPLVRQ